MTQLPDPTGTRRPAHPDDPRALIRESYRIEGLGVEDARGIFFDWVLGLPAGRDPAAAAAALLAHHREADAVDGGHPMSVLLAEAAEGNPARPRRRGRAGRRTGG